MSDADYGYDRDGEFIPFDALEVCTNDRRRDRRRTLLRPHAQAVPARAASKACGDGSYGTHNPTPALDGANGP